MAEPQNIRDAFNEAIALGHPVMGRIFLDTLVTVVGGAGVSWNPNICTQVCRSCWAGPHLPGHAGHHGGWGGVSWNPNIYSQVCTSSWAGPHLPGHAGHRGGWGGGIGASWNPESVFRMCAEVLGRVLQHTLVTVVVFLLIFVVWFFWLHSLSPAAPAHRLPSAAATAPRHRRWTATPSSATTPRASRWRCVPTWGRGAGCAPWWTCWWSRSSEAGGHHLPAPFFHR